MAMLKPFWILAFLIVVAASEQRKQYSIIVFGGTGDLASRYLWNAFFHEVYLEADVDSILAVGTSPPDSGSQKLEKGLKNAISCPPSQGESSYCAIKAKEFQRLIEYFQVRDEAGLGKLCSDHNRFEDTTTLLYLSIWPRDALTTLHGIFNFCSKHTITILIEKPYSENYAGASELVELAGKLQQQGNKRLLFVDHYLGKPAVMAIPQLRALNSHIFERMQLKSLHLALEEERDVPVERVKKYDDCGVFMDVIQNHLSVVLSEAVSRNMEETLSQTVWEGKAWLGQHSSYRQQLPHSSTATFGAIDLRLKSSAGSPVDVRLWSGKYLSANLAYVHYIFEDDIEVYLVINPVPCLLWSSKTQLQLPKEFITQDSEKRDVCTQLRFDNCSDFEIAQWDVDRFPLKNAYRNVVSGAIDRTAVPFPSAKNVLSLWKFWDPILASLRTQKVFVYHSSADVKGIIDTSEENKKDEL